MFVLASIPIIRTTPIPPVFFLLNGFKEKFTHYVRFASLNDLPLPLPYLFSQLLLRQLTQLPPSYCIHYQLRPLVDVEIDLFSTVHGEIVRVYAFLALLTESLLEIGADSVGRILLFLRILHALQSIDIFVQWVEQHSLFFSLLLQLFAFIFLGL